LNLRAISANGLGVFLFKSILETKTAGTPADDKRKLARYVVGPAFPFKTTLFLHGEEEARTNNTKDTEWSATLVNLSAAGASMQLSRSAAGFQRERCGIRFSHGDYLLELPAAVVHFRRYSQYSLCGVHFDLPDEISEQSYRQFITPVVIGNSLLPLEPVDHAPDRHEERFGGPTSATMSVWRDAPGGRITGFDLRMHRYVVRWTEGMTELEVYWVADVMHTPGTPVATWTTPSVPLNAEQHEEVRWLFCLMVPNLTKSVPRDVREFLSAVVA